MTTLLLLKSLFSRALTRLILLVFSVSFSCLTRLSAQEISLSGTWQYAERGMPSKAVQVPGLSSPANRVNSDTVFLSRTFNLNKDQLSNYVLRLKGARFCPSVWINGSFIGYQAGGMAPVNFTLLRTQLRMGENTIKIGLLPLSKVPADDASKIPSADIWRSNVSSCIWDDVVLEPCTDNYIKASAVFPSAEAGKAWLNYETAAINSAAENNRLKFRLQIKNSKSEIVVDETFPALNGKAFQPLNFGNKLQEWSPEKPVLYQLSLELLNSDGKTIHRHSQDYGQRSFKIEDKKFYLNRKPITIRALSVVWHRWVRDTVTGINAWDTLWFKHNILKPAKDMGANTIRFHLGMPPEPFLRLCDKEGFLVQAEWSFFHGIKGSPEYMLSQWDSWFKHSLKHTSVINMHAWNETEEPDELAKAEAVIERLSSKYPEVVIGHRDVIHVHKYWWSLFENLGLYYDSYQQFPKAIMVDEFGGNYLDYQGDVGAYPTTKESYLRFLGANHTKVERLKHHALANAKVAEYWRCIGAAGYSPFCVLGSIEDGNTWFLKERNQLKPMPVWQELRAAFASRSAILQLWDRNFYPQQSISPKVFLFNETDKPLSLELIVRLKSGKKVLSTQRYKVELKAYESDTQQVKVMMPKESGAYEVESFFTGKEENRSWWSVQVLKPELPQWLKTKKIYTKHTALAAYFKANGIGLSTDLRSADLVILHFDSSKQAAQSQEIQQAVKVGKPVLLLQFGLQNKGQGYLKDDQLGPLQGVSVVRTPERLIFKPMAGIELVSTEAAEPESHIFAATKLDSTILWQGLNKEHTRLWNGYRGGLITPAAVLNIKGLKSSAFLHNWLIKGADTNRIKQDNQYLAVEIEGFYAFGHKDSLKAISTKLRGKVKFLVDDAPALKNKVNVNSAAVYTNLNEAYNDALYGVVEGYNSPVLAGRGLKQSPILKANLGKSRLVVSNLLLSERTYAAESNRLNSLWQARKDPSADQFLFNLMEYSMRP